MAKIRKLLSLLLCLVMVLSFFPAAYAEGESEGTITEEQDCDHDHEQEEETQGSIALVEEEPEDELVGDGVLDVPEADEAGEEHEGLVRVEFICDPEDAIITVYDPSQTDENGDPIVIEPEEDGTWLLAPGEYLYDAEREGYAGKLFERLAVEKTKKAHQIEVSLLPEQLVSSYKQIGNNADKTSTSYSYLLDVPLYGQETHYTCADGSARMVITYYFNHGFQTGYSSTAPSESQLVSKYGKGSVAPIENGLRDYCGVSYGVEWKTNKETFYNYLYESLSRGKPIVINITLSSSSLFGYTAKDGHYVVAVGLSRSGDTIKIVINDPYSASSFHGEGFIGQQITLDFDDVYEVMNYIDRENTGLVVSPPEYADTCDVYPTWLTVTTTSGTSVMSQPCSSGTDSSSTQVKYLSKDSKFEVTDVYVNTYGVCWYKGKVVSSGEEGYLFSGNCSVTEYKTNRITASDNKYDPPTQLENPHGFYVTWLLSSEHLWLDYIWGDITNTETGESGLINKAEISNVRSLTYRLGSENSNEPVDANMPFSKLSPGHYIAQVSVKPVYYYGTGADGKTLSQYRKQTADRPISFSFDVVPQGTHVHDRGTYMYYEEAHPHRKCYQCSSCGTIWADSNSYTVLPGCADCRPEKPVLIGLEGTHNALEPVTFTWNDTARTTHYNIWIYKQNGSGEYEYYDHTNYVSSGYQLNCSVGNYKAELQAYNSDLWESDNSDWVHTTSDPTFFTVVMPTYIISYNANGGTGAPEPQEKLYDVTLTLSDTKPTRADEAAGSYTVTLDPRGGSVSSTKLTAARTTSYTFKNWNTAANGSGTAYNPGANYTANADVTLYAQWNSSTTTAAVTLPTPTRDGYNFKGWATSAAATSGMTGSYTPSGDVTLYAIWEQTTAGNLEILSVTGHPGNEILVPIRLSSNPGLYTITFHLNFDSAVLQLTGVENGTLTGWSFSQKSGYVHWETPDDMDKTGSGVIVKLRFQILENAADGELALSIDDLEAFNREEKAISFGRIPGTVTVSSRTAGDVNGDGEISILDLVRLRKYLMHDPTNINAANADVTGDGSVNSQDLVRLRKYLAGDPYTVLD